MKKQAETISARGQRIPFYHFVFEGEFYKYLRIRNNRLLTDGARINEFFVKKSFEHYDFNNPYFVFNRAVMIIIHCFSDFSKRDLDNNCYKPVIDGIRKTGIIPDDNWRNLSLMILGDIISGSDKQERIETYIVPHQFFKEFITSKVIDPNIFEKFTSEYIYTNKEYEENNDSFW